jgi:hypothetical protein
LPPGSHTGASTPEANATPAKLVAVQREIGALTSLHPPASLRSPVRQLVGILMRLQQFYQAGGQGSAGLPQGAIAVIEQQATGAAIMARVPVCASLTRPR